MMRMCLIFGMVGLLFVNASPVAGVEEPIVLTLEDCIRIALEHNRELIVAREKIEEVGGQTAIAHSRFLLHLDVLGKYDATRTEIEGEEEEIYESSVKLTQRLLEFGKDTQGDIGLRETERQTIYAYESKLRDVLSNIRRQFFLVLLRDAQIQIRRDNLKEFERKLYKVQKEFETGQLVSLFSVLTAELNALNEEVSINDLERDRLRSKMQLLQLLGRPMGDLVGLSGALTDFEMDEEEAVRIAKQNSISVALARERLAEQRRLVRKLNWDYMPDLAMQGGVESGRKKAGMEVSNSQDTWGLDLSSEYQLSEREESPGYRDEDRTDWFANLQVRVPVLEGWEREGRARMETAKLHQRTAELKKEEELVELAVRQAYQTLLGAAESRRLMERRVQIDRRRFELQTMKLDRALIQDDELETFRSQFFSSQDRFFTDQNKYISAQEDLRKAMGYFE